MPTNILPTITQQTFLGASIVNFSINQSYNEQQSQLNITLVEDPRNNPRDDFLLKEENTYNYNGQAMWTVQTFTYGGFSYTGILQTFDESRSIEGYPLYTVVLSSPTRILAAAQVGLAGYIGPGNDSVFNSTSQGTSTFQVSNFLNVYGYLEDGGAAFGRSAINDIGIPWLNNGYGLYDALVALTNTPPPPNFDSNNFFGCYITFKTQYYRLDLSNLPTPPTYYRIGGAVNMTLLELISRFMADAGVDYIVTLKQGQGNGPHTIGFITVPRVIQPNLGQISQFIASQTNLSSVTHGQEVRDDITQKMLVGGAINFLQPLQNEFSNNGQFNFGLTPNAILPFWGFDVNGNPILGQKLNGNMSFADDDMQMNLNGAAIADILGELGLGLSYPCSVLELRCALANYDTWAAYIAVNKPTMADALRLFGAWDPRVIPAFPGVDENGVPFASILQFMPDMIAEQYVQAQDLFESNTKNHWPGVLHRIYDFVANVAETYYGKQFLVQLPFNINIKLVPQSTQVVLSDELADAGYLPEDSNILHLNFINEQFFLDDTGRFYPFVGYNAQDQFGSVYTLKATQGSANLPLPPRQVNADFSKIDNGSVVQPGTSIFGTASFGPDGWEPWAQDNTHIYVRCEQGVDGPISQNGALGGGSQIFFTPVQGFGVATPCTIVSVPNAIWAQADDRFGNYYDLSAMIGVSFDSLANATHFQINPFNMFIHPPALYPQAIALALKSNQFVYGPWGKFTTNGRLDFEQDEGLTPWDCGSYFTMNQVAQAKINQIAMGNQVLERANLLEAGIPSYNIGQTLFQDGPIINSISCSIGTDGVKTTYTLETFVNRIAAFSLENAEILKRQGKIYQQLRRAIRQQVIQSVQRASLFQSNYNGFMYGTTYALQEHSPHPVLGGVLGKDQNTGKYVPYIYTQTQQESVKNVGFSGQFFLQSACMGLEGLLRPYTVDVKNDNLPWYFAADPVATGLMTKKIASSILNPFKSGSDINWILNGEIYGKQNNRLHAGDIDFTSLRPIALRGPIVMQGWGLDFLGNPIPNANTPLASSGQIYPLASYNNKYAANYLTNSIDWPTAPVDLRFNKFHGTWISPGMIICGVISGGNINGGQMGHMQIYINNNPTEETMQVWNFYTDSSATLVSGLKIMTSYDLLSNKWVIPSAACNLATNNGGGFGGGGGGEGTGTNSTAVTTVTVTTGTDTGTSPSADMMSRQLSNKKKNGGLLMLGGAITIPASGV